MYGLWTNRSISFDFLFPFLFSIPAGIAISIFSRVLGSKINKVISYLIVSIISLIYLVYLIYYSIFKVPLSLYSITGAKDAFQFGDVIISAIRANLMAVILFLLPLLILYFLSRSLVFLNASKKQIFISIILLLFFFLISLTAVSFTQKKHNSQYMLYYKVSSLQLSVGKLGLLTTIRLDFQRLVFGFEEDDIVEDVIETEPVTASTAAAAPVQTETAAVTTAAQTVQEIKETQETTETIPEIKYNKVEIDFESLIKNESSDVIIDMHKYFSSIEAVPQNEYTGMFSGKNLILIVAEAFYPYAVSEELTPTLYKMSTEGFVFNNFYNPLFGVSTSDGEYTTITSLLPKTGVWSFYVSGRNYMPFAFGNQFRDIGYIAKAYHDHTYTYYNRDISHPNIGYDYKGIGNGLDVKVTWPESDLEMIEKTTEEYIKDAPFHVYYLTISGHLQYNFGGNFIAKKNRELVEHLPYSNPSKAYLACNLELEFAVAELINRLEEVGELENTVIAISPDHYPYGLVKSSIDELSGHKVESNFELHKGIFILWNSEMEPIIVDEFCSSLDINPTISNLFGLEYDSRLLMGNDIFSSVEPLVIFPNRSWITEKARYNSINDKAEFFEPYEYDEGYVKQIHNKVIKKFKYSTSILDNDYYNVLRRYLD